MDLFGSTVIMISTILIVVALVCQIVVFVPLLTLPLLQTASRWLPWRRAADRRAERLLRSVLTREEYRSLCLRGYVELPSQLRADRVYRIPRRRGTVDIFEQGRYHSTLCIAPVAALPDDDVVAAHTLTLQTDEAHYLRVANLVDGAHWHQPPPLRPPRRPNLVLRVLGASLITVGCLVATAQLLALLELPSTAQLTVTAVTISLPAIFVALSILAGLAVILLGDLLSRRSTSQPTADRRRPT